MKHLTKNAMQVTLNKSITIKLISLFLVGFGLIPATAFASYSISADGSEVTDTATGLIWRRCVEGKVWSGTTCTGTANTYPLGNAFRRATAEASSSGKAWRLPNVKELYSLVNLTPTGFILIDEIAFPGTPQDISWSSTPSVGSAYSYIGTTYTWQVSFGSGHVESSNRSSYMPIRLVR